jgi:hypothetical protein
MNSLRSLRNRISVAKIVLTRYDAVETLDRRIVPELAGDIATISTRHKALSQRLAKRAALTQESARSISYVKSPRC